MRLVLSRCHGENPVSFGVADGGEACEFVEWELFIRETFLKSGNNQTANMLYNVTAKFLNRQGYEDKETA